MTENPAQERRRYERYPIYCPLEYKAEDEQPKESSITLNISEGGALISARRDLTPASNVIVKMKFRDELFFILGKIKHAKRDENGDAYEIGVEFWDRPKTFVKKFYEELDGIRDYQRRYREEQAGEISLAEASLNWYKDTCD
ncbi:MAG: PilZ domain-containing protein [Candidatus Omnitrophica bacterium]|nr:PilZ domain-containing protein [Candidatus Omnitrophota bacterium]MDD5436617.1 PilZ domain-containing protein [Candidatus Omnitrophota bacterium]